MSEWVPLNVPPLFANFKTSIGIESLERACRALGVTRKGEARVSYTRRAIGSSVADAAGRLTWLKVNAHLVAGNVNRMRAGEESPPRLDGLSSPKVLRFHDWVEQGFAYRALETSLASSPAIESRPLAGVNAARVSDAWITQFKRTALRLRAVETQRFAVSQADIETAIRERFGPHAPFRVSEWHVAHGDPNWGNVTGPELALLDWEFWGMAPRGFDLAYLTAFSCSEPELQRRLETAFADELETPSGRVAYLAALALVLNRVEAGWLAPDCREQAWKTAEAVIENHRRLASTRRTRALVPVE